MISSLQNMSELLESGYMDPEEHRKTVDSAVRTGLLLMAGYPRESFLPEEIKFVSEFMIKLKEYALREDDFHDEF